MGLDFRILGELEVLRDGDPIDIGPPRQRAVLARLLISPGAVVSTDRIVEDLWRSQASDSTRHTVHVYISRLRKALGPDRDRLLRQGGGYRIAVKPRELDAWRAEELATDGREALARHDAESASSTLADALRAWRGDSLCDFCDETFARDESVRLDELRLATLEHRLWADLELGRHNEVIGELQDMVAKHPLRETFWEQLMLALYRSDRQAEALRVCQAARTQLAEELGIEPGHTLRVLEQRILSQDPSLDISTEGSAGRRIVELPPQRTSFIGREQERAICAKLLAESRILTLTGPPGSGKTRLALQLAADCVDGYPHGVFFVPLAAITNPRLVDETIAQTLELHQVPGQTVLEGVKSFFRNRRALLVLDNFEHVLRAAPHVGELLDAAPELTIMVTSRAPLQIGGEQEYPVLPLSVPPESAEPSPESIAAFDAVALFVARSRSADPAFELSSDNASDVARITTRVEGLPLALELAAARIKLLPPHELLSRLDRRLTLLTGAPTDATDRHRTMRDAVGWSFELLEPAHQVLLRRLGVFAGGFTLDAAAAVADLPEWDALDGIHALLTQSLLYRPVTVGPARFAMLETMREFASEQLLAAGEDEAIRRRHAEFFKRLAGELEPVLGEKPGGGESSRLGIELNNLRGALTFALEAPDPDLGLQLAGCIWRYWASSDQLHEGRDWLECLLALPDAAEPARAAGLEGLAGLAYWQGDPDEALAHYTELLGYYRRIGDRPKEAETLYSMSLSASWKKDLDTGERLAGQALALFEELGSRAGVGKALFARAAALWWRHEYATAHGMWVEALEIAGEVGDDVLALTGLAGLAGITFELGRVAEAVGIAVDGVVKAVEADDTHVTVWMLDLVAALAAAEHPEMAVRLSAAATRMREEGGGGLVPEALQLESAKTIADRLLAPGDVRRAWMRGRAMDLDAAVELAHRLGRPVPTPSEAV